MLDVLPVLARSAAEDDERAVAPRVPAFIGQTESRKLKSPSPA